MHGQGKIAMDQIDLADADVVVHELAVGGSEERLAGRALEIAEDFHSHGCVLRAEGRMRIHVRDSSGGLRHACRRKEYAT